MKTKLITAFLICFFANIFIAQTLVRPSEFKLSSTAAFLKTKGFDILEQTDTFIKIGNKEKATLYIDLASEKKFLLLNMNILLRKDITKEEIDSLINEINSLDMIKANYLANQHAISFKYYFWMVNGFTYESLEDAVNEFFLYQGDAYALDKEKIFNYQQ
ncbi:hypothetical protein QFZ37_000527 [Chryseobacterium ginsenosidimutans]|uniref:hypothetical protein n=1 Tax=Chryseobacterium ginsenosidimutans TaxID=687846 RepID=UPI00277F9D80|nr:hypothetical protein [Chryseobacterium ginsenosidimutans]MDQ0592158.1 hypothetical protein [Chryseobacterium ginsenosidimutans]